MVGQTGIGSTGRGEDPKEGSLAGNWAGCAVSGQYGRGELSHEIYEKLRICQKSMLCRICQSDNKKCDAECIPQT